MPLPFDPQPLNVLQQRWPLALERRFDAESVCLGSRMRPDELPSQVFDFQDGLRLIVSVEEHRGQARLHVSASITPQYPLTDWLFQLAETKTAAHVMEQFRRTAEASFSLISRIDCEELELVQVTEQGVPHWVAPWANAVEASA